MQTQTTTQASSTNTEKKANGTSFDLARKVGTAEDGKAQWERHGTLFMRANGSGGIIYLKLGEQELEVAVFPRRLRK
jgi:hypothetical protein